MYTRSYDENLGIVIPESYGGTLLREEARENNKGAAAPPDESEAMMAGARSRDELHTDSEDKSEGAFSFMQNLPFGNFFKDIFKKGSFGLQKIGSEEILIIATAAFLLFSKSGDKECAIMLLLLLFMA